MCASAWDPWKRLDGGISRTEIYAAVIDSEREWRTRHLAEVMMSKLPLHPAYPPSEPDDDAYSPPKATDAARSSRGVSCPCCEVPIDFLTIAGSNIPWHVTCPYCHRDLCFEDTTLLKVGLFFFWLFVCFALVQTRSAVFGFISIRALLLPMLLFAIPVQCVLAEYLRRRGRLGILPTNRKNK
jgi:hypothetical protein